MHNNAENIANCLLWQDSQPTERAMHIADAHVVESKQGRAKVELLDFHLGRQRKNKRQTEIIANKHNKCAGSYSIHFNRYATNGSMM